MMCRDDANYFEKGSFRFTVVCVVPTKKMRQVKLDYLEVVKSFAFWLRCPKTSIEREKKMVSSNHG